MKEKKNEKKNAEVEENLVGGYKFSLPYRNGMEEEEGFVEKVVGRLLTYQHEGEIAKFEFSFVKTLEEMVRCSGKTKEECIAHGARTFCENRMRNETAKNYAEKYKIASATGGVTKTVLNQVKGELRTLLRQGMERGKALDLLKAVLADSIENYGYGLTPEQVNEVVSKL